MTLNKQEFKILVMLYAANIDGNVQSEEVKVMLKKSGFDTVEKMEKLSTASARTRPNTPPPKQTASTSSTTSVLSSKPTRRYR